MFDAEQDVPLDLFVGLLREEQAVGILLPPGIYELPFVNNYSRVPTTQIDWITPDNITMWNAANFIFPLASEDWGKITHFGLWLSASGNDDCLCVGDLHVSKYIRKGNHISFQMKKIDVLIEQLAHEYEQYKFGGGQHV